MSRAERWSEHAAPTKVAKPLSSRYRELADRITETLDFMRAVIASARDQVRAFLPS
jgi:3-deoxy-D-arabino-heptulosonate 7-phosphate (DAHP) synthase class II